MFRILHRIRYAIAYLGSYLCKNLLIDPLEQAVNTTFTINILYDSLYIYETTIPEAYQIGNFGSDNSKYLF